MHCEMTIIILSTPMRSAAVLTASGPARSAPCSC